LSDSPRELADGKTKMVISSTTVCMIIWITFVISSILGHLLSVFVNEAWLSMTSVSVEHPSGTTRKNPLLNRASIGKK